MLAFIEKLAAQPDSIEPADIDALREAGLSEAAIEDAILVSASFHMITRLADAFEFAVPGSWEPSVKNLLSRGYA